MIMIPSNIAYFVLGFISCFVLVAIIITHIVRKEAQKEVEMTRYILENLPTDSTIKKDKDE